MIKYVDNNKQIISGRMIYLVKWIISNTGLNYITYNNDHDDFEHCCPDIYSIKKNNLYDAHNQMTKNDHFI